MCTANNVVAFELQTRQCSRDWSIRALVRHLVPLLVTYFAESELQSWEKTKSKSLKMREKKKSIPDHYYCVCLIKRTAEWPTWLKLEFDELFFKKVALGV